MAIFVIYSKKLIRSFKMHIVGGRDDQIWGMPRQTVHDGLASRSISPKNPTTQHGPGHMKPMTPSQADLPVSQYKSKIIDSYKKYDTLIIVGETGSGKSTQVPKFIHEHVAREEGRPELSVAVTQPRRVAAIALAKRVSEEMGETVGRKVGYSVRFDEVVSEATRIKYLTDGMLLRETMSDKRLLKYSTIVLDEAHERTLRTDVLFGILKRVQDMRKDTKNPLKIVIMSATLNPEKFLNFFSRPFVLNIPGRVFPVKICYTTQPQQDYLDAAIVTIFQLHQDASKRGDILVFLTGQEEIDTVAKLLEEYGPSCPPPAPKMIIVPIYAALSSSQQMSVFRATPQGCRKIVLATNIAETSITIPGIRFVIDPGFVKMRSFNPRVGIETLSVVPISKASARQRAGRAGREAAGECYRLFVEDALKSIEEETTPEIFRTNLANVVLTMKACGIENVIKFDYLEAPPADSLTKGLEELLALGALGDDGSISLLGKTMAECPLTPQLSRVLLEAGKLRCTEEALSIISMLSVDNIFTTSIENREQSTTAKRNMSHSSGDHITLLTIFRSFQSAKQSSSRWCQDNCIDEKGMSQVLEVRKQLVGFCEKWKIKLETCGADYSAILQCLCAGFHMQIATLQSDRSYRTLLGRQQVHIHPSSVLHMKKPECILFHEVTLTSKCYLRTVSSVQPDWVLNYIKKNK